jgi:hypothetical protein
MNKLLLTAALALALVPSAHGQAAASTPTPTPPASPLGDLKVSGDFDYESEYVYRGKKVTNSAFQPSVNGAETVYGGSLNEYIWTSQPIGRAGGGGGSGATAGPNENNEIDIGLYWQHSVPGVDALTGEIGWQQYWYPDLGGFNPPNGLASRTEEFHIGGIYDTTNLIPGKINLSPTLKYYHDVILDSNTITGAINYSWDLSDNVLKGLSLNPTFTLGYTDLGRSFGDVAGQNWKDSWSFWELDLELDYVLGNSTTAYIAGHYAGNNDGTTGGFNGGNPNAPGSDNDLWFGLGVKWNM